MKSPKVLFSRLDEISRNIAIQSGGTIASQLIPIVAAPLFTRLYSPEEFGVYGLVIFVSSLVAIVFTLRIDHGVVVVASMDDAQTLTRVSLIMAASAAVICGVFAALIQVWWPFPGTSSPFLVWALLCPAIGLTVAAMRTLTLWNNRVRNFGHVSKSRIQRSVWTVIASVVAGFWEFGLVLGVLIGNSIGTYLLARGLPKGAWPGVRAVPQAIGANSRFAIFSLPADLINTTAARVPIVLFPAYYGLEQGGFLTLSYLVIAAPVRFVGSATGEVFYSYAARAFEQTGSCRHLVLRIGGMLAIVSALGFGTLYLVSDMLFRLAFGPEWLPASTYTKLLIPMLAVHLVSSPLSVVFYIAGKQKQDLWWQIAFVIGVLLVSVVTHAIWATPDSMVLALGLQGCFMYALYLAMIWRYSEQDERQDPT